MKVKSESEVAQSRPTLSDPTDCSPPGSPVHRVFQARVLEWAAIDLLHRSLTWPTRGIPMLLHPLYPYLTTRCPQASRKPGKRDVSQDRCRANGLDCVNHRSTPTQCGDSSLLGSGTSPDGLCRETMPQKPLWETGRWQLPPTSSSPLVKIHPRKTSAPGTSGYVICQPPG